MTAAWSITLTGLAHYDCPRCGAVLVMRVNGDTGKGFYGCTHFPHCRGTRELDGTTGGHPDPHGNMDSALEDSGLDNNGWGND